MDELLLEWLRWVLDDKARVARLPLVSGSAQALADRERAQRTALAQIDGERDVVELAAIYLDPANDPVAVGLAEKVLTRLAHGHRYDRPGWREEWAPSSARIS